MAAPGVRIVDFPETPVAVLPYRGEPEGLSAAVRRFAEWRREAGLTPSRSATYTILHASPAAGADFRHDLCAAAFEPIASNDAGVQAGVIPGGRCAVVRLEDGDRRLGPTLEWLYRSWLPASGEALRPDPPFAHRISWAREGSEGGMVTDIYLPLVSAARATVH